jgi:hypothetical protein
MEKPQTCAWIRKRSHARILLKLEQIGRRWSESTDMRVDLEDLADVVARGAG